ncbi:MAG TPA: DUF1552 domain-containing protein [Vicinamibacterales bacterium]|jgi:hypothetical protein|nr:DUF1552 domain-containing protein [Vicinamibacterales bacterium]
MIVTKAHLSRRTVLRGLGVSLALPLLDSMVPALTALGQTAAAPVRRLGVFYVPNGMSMPYWWPKAEGPLKELPPTLQSLNAHKDKVLLCGGLADEAANLVKGGGDHARSAGTFLTCVPFKITAGADVYAAVSMDQIAAAELSKKTQLASLELGIESNAMLGACDGGASCAYTNTIAWRTPTTPLPIENDPRAVFERLFGTTGSTDPQARLARMKRDRSILDFVGNEVENLGRVIGPQDATKIGEFLDAVRDVERRIQMAEAQNSRELPVVEQPVGVPTDYAEHARLMMDLLALAYQTDLTRISTFMLAREVSGHAYPEIGVTDSHHPLSHHQDEPAKLERLHKINEYHFRQFGYLVGKLAAMPEGDGTMLDHTVFLYGTGISDSNTHFHDDLPIAIVGGKAAGIKGGRYIRQPKGTPLANLHLTILDKLGFPLEKLGDSTGRLDRLVAV